MACSKLIQMSTDQLILAVLPVLTTRGTCEVMEKTTNRYLFHCGPETWKRYISQVSQNGVTI